MRPFKRFHKINRFYLAADAADAWDREVAQRAGGKRFPWHQSFAMHHNPLVAPRLAMRWIVERYAPMLRYLDEHPPRRIVELGSAHGLSAWLMTDVAEEVWGVDISPEMVEIAGSLFPECSFSASGFADFFRDHPADGFDMAVDCYGPWGRDLAALLAASGTPWLHTGYRTTRWREVFTWSNKLKGRHLGFETTLVAPGAKGADAGYVSWFFSRRYLGHLKHSLSHGLYPQL